MVSRLSGGLSQSISRPGWKATPKPPLLTDFNAFTNISRALITDQALEIEQRTTKIMTQCSRSLYPSGADRAEVNKWKETERQQISDIDGFHRKQHRDKIQRVTGCASELGSGKSSPGADI